ncbi:aromatic alcohol reductase [Stutzerimonas azotifigens]|uniref:Aromatic alcohol reductase n=1 Tax=Stutzerimonas azotifigens TaxID=291995 RepID=A0ABR5Z6A3_9GAMM|nr:aromatic alcohol reductase [Stutzerimonas azotifigens]MBA1275725.1 aromatic alcohol reductase [Stutzerimonas azotifigens]
MQTPNPTQDILVLGAGELGVCVLRELARVASSKGEPRISVLLRPSAIATGDASRKRLVEEIHRLGIGILRADVINDSIDALSEHFSRFDTVISCVGFTAGAGIQLKITRAVLAAGVKRYVPWQFGVDYDVIGKGSPQDLFDEQLDVRGLLRAQQKTEWLIISTGMFTSFLFEPIFGVVDLEKNTVHALGSWDTEVTVTTPEDIGLMTAHILFAEPRVANQVVFVAGDTLSYAQLADAVDATLNRTVLRVEWTLDKLRDDLVADPDDPIKKYRAVFAEGEGVAWPKRRTYNAEHGLNLTTTADWIEQHMNYT